MMSRFCSLMHPIVEANEYPQLAPYVSLCKAARSLTGRARPRVTSDVTPLTFGRSYEPKCAHRYGGRFKRFSNAA